MKKFYIHPQVMDVLYAPNLMDPLKPSGSGPEPTAPERKVDGGEFLPL